MCAELASAMQAVLRVEGANIIPFTANNLNIFVTAVVTQLPNVTAKDIVISQVHHLPLSSIWSVEIQHASSAIVVWYPSRTLRRLWVQRMTLPFMAVSVSVAAFIKSLRVHANLCRLSPWCH